MTGAIYTPAGMAREYAARACNLFRGCEHGCSYCYSPSVLRMTRGDFHAASLPRKGILEALRKEAPAAAVEGERVLFCFTSDPYGPHEAEHGTTRKALQILADAGCPFDVLTKGGLRACRDFDLLAAAGGAFGTTLSWLNDEDRAAWEPNAASVNDRLLAICRAHDQGIRTWISIEPVVDPTQALGVIAKVYAAVDEFRVGKWNHDARANWIDWRRFAADAVALVQSLGARYLIKDALAAYLPEGVVTDNR